ncbi:unnamed protein product [Calypogeia fissa]
MTLGDASTVEKVHLYPKPNLGIGQHPESSDWYTVRKIHGTIPQRIFLCVTPPAPDMERSVQSPKLTAAYWSSMPIG